MQYVRSIIPGSVSRTWNSINPATLSGAIDVIVVEQEDGSFACSPFHIRFGKFSLLRPSEKKVVFKVNGNEQPYPMKLGEGGEAFFVFETSDQVPEALQTSPLASPVLQPTKVEAEDPRSATPTLKEPESLDLEVDEEGGVGKEQAWHTESATESIPIPSVGVRAHSHAPGHPITLSAIHAREAKTTGSSDGQRRIPGLERADTDSVLPTAKAAVSKSFDSSSPLSRDRLPLTERGISHDRSSSPPPVSQEDAVTRAINLSKKLWTSNIPTQVNDSGDLMLDMTGYKSSENEALRAEGIARQLLAEEIDGPYDIGALIGADEKGNLWIYSSEEAKETAGRKAAQGLGSFNPAAYASTDAISDPGYASDDAASDGIKSAAPLLRRDSDSAVDMTSNPASPGIIQGELAKNYAKTLRLTSDQLKSMDLRHGANSMSFSVNRATCTATLWYWRHDVPIVISDIDGTITKSDALGHVLTMIGRDWTHQGVAKLYTEIAANGYNFLYLTSRSVGQADATRAYLDGVVQEGGYKLPKGPVILSPDRTIAALRREIYLRKPELFKMACLRDIMSLFSGHGGNINNVTHSQEAGLHADPSFSNEQPSSLGTNRGRGGSPFYAGFGNRLTDALSYRSVNIPSTRIFTINSNSEVSLDLLSLNNYKTGYASMREIVDHYFPPVGLLIKGGGEEFTDFNYWRDKPLDVIDFTDSESEDSDDEAAATRLGGSPQRPKASRMATSGTIGTRGSVLSEDEGMADSYFSDPRMSLEDSLIDDDGRPSLEDLLHRSSLEYRTSIDDSQIFSEDGEYAEDEGEDEEDEMEVEDGDSEEDYESEDDNGGGVDLPQLDGAKVKGRPEKQIAAPGQRPKSH